MFSALLAQVASVSLGEMVLVLAFWLAMLLLILKCWSISRRPSANRKCALSLTLILGAFLVSSMAGASQSFLGHSEAALALFNLLNLLSLGGIGFSIVLAFQGLGECSRDRKRYTQGKAQAIWTLSLAGSAILVIGSFVVQIMPLLIHTKTRPGPGQTVTFDDLNFRFRAPQPPWYSVNPNEVKNVKLLFARHSPEARFLLEGGQFYANDGDFTTELYADSSLSPSSKVISKIPRQVGILTGIEVQTIGGGTRSDQFYLEWFCVSNGFAYHLLGWGRIENRNKLLDDLRDSFAGFEQIDPARRGSPAPRPATSVFQGYSGSP